MVELLRPGGVDAEQQALGASALPPTCMSTLTGVALSFPTDEQPNRGPNAEPNVP